MPLVYYNKITHSNVGVALHDLVAWLLDDETSASVTALSSAWLTANGGSGGAGWTLIETFSATTSSVREIPGTTTGDGTLDSLPTATNGWRTGTLTVGDWCVLESLGPNPYQLYLEYEDDGASPGPNSGISYKLMPLAALGGADDFTTGGSVTTPPTADFPATSVPASGFITRDLSASGSPVQYAGNADDQTINLIDDTGTTGAGYIYIGALDGVNLTADPFPYVIYNSTSLCRFDTSDIPWRRLSPVDRATVINGDTLRWNNNTSNQGGGDPSQLDLSLGTGSHPLFPLGCMFLASNHQHFAGFLRNVGGISEAAGAKAAINDPSDPSGEFNFIFRNDAGTFDNGFGITIRWDGVTAWP